MGQQKWSGHRFVFPSGTAVLSCHCGWCLVWSVVIQEPGLCQLMSLPSLLPDHRVICAGLDTGASGPVLLFPWTTQRSRVSKLPVRVGLNCLAGWPTGRIFLRRIVNLFGSAACVYERSETASSIGQLIISTLCKTEVIPPPTNQKKSRKVRCEKVDLARN